ncbi:MAG: malonyl-[acyl-carrier protein] O-methyltransferase BioC [Planctomycetota bacterium]|nr:MAG: malonyl-[acyl-carrier protein] O-methyltransferase BioC [Planctomycetota bacterium]
MTEALSRDFDINTLSVNDLVPQLCASASSRVSALVPEVLELPGNIEEIPLPVGLDLIVSSSTFQWFCDYASSIHRMAEALLPGGNLVFSLFSKGTMMQVRSLTGVGITYLSDEELLGPLKADLDLLHFETVKHSLFFENPREVLRHIQDTGVSGVADFHWTVAALRRFERQYVERFGTMRGVSLDYVSRFVVARKKGRGQS